VLRGKLGGRQDRAEWKGSVYGEKNAGCFKVGEGGRIRGRGGEVMDRGVAGSGRRGGGEEGGGGKGRGL